MATRRSRRKSPRTAFVLGGGGNLGAIQAGMLKALSDHEIGTDLVLGCSVGALNGAAYCADPSPRGVRRIRDVWETLADGDSDLMPSSFIPSPVQLVRKGESLHGDEGLRKTIVNFLGAIDRFDELEVPFQCVATDVDDAVEKWFDSGDLVEPIVASAALPSVYPMVEVDGRRYMDGGVVNNVPLRRAFELGAQKIYVLHVGLHGRPRTEIRRPLDAALVAYWIARNARFARDLAEVPDDVEVVVLPPGDRPVLRYDDFEHSSALFRQGFDSADTYLRDLEAEGIGDSLAERLAADTRRVIDELVGKVTGRRSGHRENPDEVDLEIEDEALEQVHLAEALQSSVGDEAHPASDEVNHDRSEDT